MLLVAADPRRPAAGDQIGQLGRDLGIDVLPAGSGEGFTRDVVRICQAGWSEGVTQGYDLVVLDTGGRLHIDDELMGELVAVKSAVQPQEVLLVADAMTGQDAVTMASQFDQRVGLTGHHSDQGGRRRTGRGAACLSGLSRASRSSFSASVKSSMRWSCFIPTGWPPAFSGWAMCCR